MFWNLTKDVKPKEGEKVMTKICDQNGERNLQEMTYRSGLWWTDGGLYVYYEPTHWIELYKYESKSSKRYSGYFRDYYDNDYYDNDYYDKDGHW